MNLITWSQCCSFNRMSIWKRITKLNYICIVNISPLFPSIFLFLCSFNLFVFSLTGPGVISSLLYRVSSTFLFSGLKCLLWKNASTLRFLFRFNRQKQGLFFFALGNIEIMIKQMSKSNLIKKRIKKQIL